SAGWHALVDRRAPADDGRGSMDQNGSRDRLTRLLLAPQKLVPWHRLPTWVGAVSLIGTRRELREKNLHNTEVVDLVAPDGAPPPPANYRTARTTDGTYNDLEFPLMGSRGTRFGRNVPLAFTN